MKLLGLGSKSSGTRWSSLVGMLVFLVILGTACGDSATATPVPTQEPTPTPSLFPMTITDSNGSEVVFEGPPQRIVTYSSVPVEVLFAIGQGQRIAGTHDFVTYPPDADDIPRVGSAFTINSEKVLELEPDLIYTFYSSSLPDLENLGVKVLYLKNPDTVEGIPPQIRLWGRLTGQVDMAEDVAGEFEAKVKEISDRVTPIEKGPRVFHDGSPGFWTVGPDTLVGQVYTLLKAQNIAEDISGDAQLSPEVIVDKDPEIIIATFEESLEIYKSDPAFQNVSAVKNGRLYHIDVSLIEVAGPRFVDGINELGKLIYPDIFR